MTFILSKLLWLLLRPSSLVVLAGWLGVVLVAARRKAAGLATLAAALGVLTVVLLLPVDAWLVGPLERRFPPVAAPPAHVDGILVLGGAVDTELTEAHGIPSLNDDAERMTTFVNLARRYPEARLAYTGGNGSLQPQALAETDVARMLFDQLGLDRPVIYEGTSRNTVENAVFLRRMVDPQPDQVWIMITSASHMPRAVGVFRQAGWTDLLPWPVAYKTGRSFGGQLQYGMPLKLAEVDWAAHEWVGLVAYWLLGRTSALFPAPR